MRIGLILAKQAAFCDLYEALLFDKARNILLDFFLSNNSMSVFYELIDHIIAVVNIFDLFICLQ